MAGDWIKWCKGFGRKSEVLSISRNMKVDRRIIACACMEFWEWADSETTDGHIAGADAAFVDGLVGLPGFSVQIEEHKWVRSTTTGMTIVNWDRHNGKSAKKRAQDANRQDDLRKRASDVTQSSRSKRDKNVTREEKRREEEKDTPQPPVGGSVVLPDILNTEAFKSAWSEWEAHRKALRVKAYTPQGLSRQYSSLAKMGCARAIAAIQHSISHNWQGIFEPSGKGVSQQVQQRPLPTGAWT